MADAKQIRVEENGVVLAQATISAPPETRDAQAAVTVAPGHLPTGTRQKMADAIHTAVCEDQAEHLTATLPRGDAELVEEIRGHLTDARLRAAGATTILEGDIDSSGAN
jgi:hypothetical protein